MTNGTKIIIGFSLMKFSENRDPIEHVRRTSQEKGEKRSKKTESKKKKERKRKKEEIKEKYNTWNKVRVKVRGEILKGEILKIKNHK
jgi:hypothetical protein